ncbi:hypothetical protein BGY98DRAFT_949832 [Russula aff. rugulosa BPL654]|nr:hypothetical protein BGY98DRAFT_949832 [Russula aff. rugulosa BPL654]
MRQTSCTLCLMLIYPCVFTIPLRVPPAPTNNQRVDPRLGCCGPCHLRSTLILNMRAYLPWMPLPVVCLREMARMNRRYRKG